MYVTREIEFINSFRSGAEGGGGGGGPKIGGDGEKNINAFYFLYVKISKVKSKVKYL